MGSSSKKLLEPAETADLCPGGMPLIGEVMEWLEDGGEKLAFDVVDGGR